jgi:phage tail-like protein
MAYEIPVGFYFRVDFNVDGGGDEVAFQEVSGLTAEVTTEEYREGGLNTWVHRLPTGVKYNNLVLKRGMFKDSKLITWCKKALNDFLFEPRNVTVMLLDEANNPLAQWQFSLAYPVKWAISDFKAQDGTLVIETLELAYAQFKRN